MAEKWSNKPKTKADVSAERLKELKQEVSRKASMANKRLNRLEKNGLTNNPAYRGFENAGGERFSVRGKDYNGLRKELARVNSFIDAKTSTVRGSNKVIKELAKNTGLKYNKLSELYDKSSKFFELYSKVEQYMKATNTRGQSLNYQKVWEVINDYVQSEGIDLSQVDSIDEYIEAISQRLTTMYDEQMEEEADEFDIFDI